MDKVGKYAFIAGLVIAAAAGLGFTQPWFYWLLAVLGVVVGLLNVTGEETHGFLLAAIALIVSATAISTIPIVGGAVTQIIGNIQAFISAAVLVVALKALFETAKD